MHLTRRELIALGAGAGSLLSVAREAWASEDFWNKKDPSTWTTEEVLLLTTRSPWAKDTRVDLKSKGQGLEPERGPDPFHATAGAPGRSEGGRTAGKGLSVVVTWESGLPLFDALHYKIPADFINHYVIGIRDLPIFVDAGPNRQSPEEIEDWLKNSATLQAKARNAVEAGVVASTREGSMLLFGFLKELIPLSVKDKQVDFALNTNQLAVKTSFEPKEMIYHGRLAL